MRTFFNSILLCSVMQFSSNVQAESSNWNSLKMKYHLVAVATKQDVTECLKFMAYAKERRPSSSKYGVSEMQPWLEYWYIAHQRKTEQDISLSSDVTLEDVKSALGQSEFLVDANDFANLATGCIAKTKTALDSFVSGKIEAPN